MKKNKIIRVGAILMFSFLIVSFVLYKSNNETDINSSAELSKNAPMNQIDSPPVKKADSQRLSPAMISTSKSMIISEPKLKFEPDSVQKEGGKNEKPEE